jgi:two-component system, LuxR family, sensor kinase FixL
MCVGPTTLTRHREEDMIIHPRTLSHRKAMRLEMAELDITGRRSVEAALRESEARTRAILETAVDAIITIDEAGIIEAYNPAAERLFGYAAREAVGQNVRMLMPPPYAREHDQYLSNYLQTGRRKIIGIGREVVGRRKDGTLFPMDLAVSEVRFGDRRLFTGIVRNITDRKLAEQTIREQKQEMEDFLCIVAHDLKRPLVSIRGLLGMMKEDIWDRLDQENRQNLELLLAECDRMSETIALLSGIARIGQVEVTSEDVDLRAFLVSVVERFRKEIDERGVDVRIDTPAETLRFPRLQVEEALENLIDNALKYGCADRQPSLLVSCAVEGSTARIGVADNGPGIPPEHHKRVFEPFRRLDSSRIAGSGVGLTAAQRLMKRINGDVKLESAPGKGATFTLVFSVTD